MQKCDSSYTDTEPTGMVPVTMKLHSLGLEYIWPDNLKTDPVSLMKCFDSETLSQLPVPLFGKYKHPFAVKEAFYNKGKVLFQFLDDFNLMQRFGVVLFYVFSFNSYILCHC